MSYLYFLTNTSNGKKFVGKSSYPKWLLKLLLYGALDNKKHYNKLLQKEWFDGVFELSFQNSDNVGKDCDKIINDENLLNPIRGYNVYAD